MAFRTGTMLFLLCCFLTSLLYTHAAGQTLPSYNLSSYTDDELEQLFPSMAAFRVLVRGPDERYPRRDFDVVGSEDSSPYNWLRDDHSRKFMQHHTSPELMELLHEYASQHTGITHWHERKVLVCECPGRYGTERLQFVAFSPSSAPSLSSVF